MGRDTQCPVRRRSRTRWNSARTAIIDSGLPRGREFFDDAAVRQCIKTREQAQRASNTRRNDDSKTTTSYSPVSGEREPGVVIPEDESTGITGVGGNVPTALTTLGERLERDLH